MYVKVLYDTNIILCHIINPLIIVLYINKEKRVKHTKIIKPNMAQTQHDNPQFLQTTLYLNIRQKRGYIKWTFCSKAQARIKAFKTGTKVKGQEKAMFQNQILNEFIFEPYLIISIKSCLFSFSNTIHTSSK